MLSPYQLRLILHRLHDEDAIDPDHAMEHLLDALDGLSHADIRRLVQIAREEPVEMRVPDES